MNTSFAVNTEFYCHIKINLVLCLLEICKQLVAVKQRYDKITKGPFFLKQRVLYNENILMLSQSDHSGQRATVFLMSTLLYFAFYFQ